MQPLALEDSPFAGDFVNSSRLGARRRAVDAKPSLAARDHSYLTDHLMDCSPGRREGNEKEEGNEGSKRSLATNRPRTPVAGLEILGDSVLVALSHHSTRSPSPSLTLSFLLESLFGWDGTRGNI